MRQTLARLLLILPGLCCADEAFHSGKVGTNGIEVVWSVPTNHWPSALWVYKVIPQHFAPPVISNLMALGSFTEGDRAKPYKRPAFRDEGLLIFRNKDETRQLVISPYLGWIQYRDEKARAERKEHPQGVPGEEEALGLAVENLRLFGVDRSHLSTKGNTGELRTYKDLRRKSWYDKNEGKEIQEITSRGIFFIRRTDGIDFSGIGPLGGVCISFANQAKIAELEIVWRGLEPFQLHKTVTAEEAVEAVQRGKAKWTPPLRDSSRIKRITVTEAMLFYRGAGGEDEQKFVEPFALLATTIENGNTNVVANLEFQILR